MRKFVLSAVIYTLVLTGNVFALSVFHIGNSFTVQNGQQGALKTMVPDLPYNHTYDMSIILGASMEFIYNAGINDPYYGYFLESVHFKKALPAKAYDYLCLQPHDVGIASDRLYGGKFLDLALQGNPSVQAYIYGLWPNRSEIGTATISATRKMSFYEALADSISADHKAAKPVLVLPVHLAVVECVLKAERGEIPGLTSRTQFFGDEGHLDFPGSYIVACTWFSCWYRTNPDGVLPDGWGNAKLTPEAAKIVRQTVWQVCSGYSRSGIVPGPLSVITPSLPAASIGSAYNATLIATGGNGKYTWRVSAGALPAGLTLNATAGTLGGQATVEGSSTFTLEVDDTDPATAVATRQYTIAAILPGKPAITTSTLPNAAKGAIYQAAIAVNGGFGTLAFTLASGALPSGLALAGTGVVSGTPAQTGTFTFTARVADGRGDTNSRAIQITVNELPNNGLIYRYYVDDTKTWNALPNFDNLSPLRTNYIANVRIGVAEQEDFFGLRFSGFIRITQPGEYTFTLSSDDGSALYINTVKLIDYDGVHGAGEKTGTVTLAAGYHAFKLDYFENSGGQGLGVSYAGPGIAKTSIPDDVFYRVDPGTVNTVQGMTRRSIGHASKSATIRYSLTGRAVSGLQTSRIKSNERARTAGCYVDRTPDGVVRRIVAP